MQDFLLRSFEKHCEKQAMLLQHICASQVDMTRQGRSHSRPTRAANGLSQHRLNQLLTRHTDQVGDTTSSSPGNCLHTPKRKHKHISQHPIAQTGVLQRLANNLGYVNSNHVSIFINVKVLGGSAVRRYGDVRRILNIGRSQHAFEPTHTLEPNHHLAIAMRRPLQVESVQPCLREE